MKPNTSEGTGLPSMYDRKQFAKAGFRVNIPVLAITLVMLLLPARFLNLGLWWLATRGELSAKPLIPGVRYAFLNLSSAAGAAEKMAEIQNRPGGNTGVHVVGYCNFLYPAIFLVQNFHGASTPVDLGQVVVLAPPGRSSYTVTLGGGVHFERIGGTKRGQADKRGQAGNEAHFDHSLALKLLGLSAPDRGGLSITVKPPEKTAAVFIPYIIYILVPLVAILVLVNFYSQAVFTAYFYFLGMFLLFDFQVLFCRVPLSWLTTQLWVSLALTGLFCLIGAFGIWKWKQRRDVFKETLVVWFFLLLPLFLRF